MTNKKIVIALIVIAIIAIGGAYMFPKIQKNIGAISGPDIYDDITFYGEVLNRGTVATSSAASATIPASSLVCDGSYVVSLPVGAVTLTLPATSTMQSKVAGAGARCSVAIVNASTTASQNITLAAGTGWKVATTTAAQLVIYPGTVGVLDFVRKANTDITAVIYNQALAQ
jgi:hypothetical protein